MSSLGIDIGGTFTDLVVYDHDAGQQWSRKVLTTHDDPARAVAAGVAAILGAERCACGSSGGAACGAGGVMARARGRGEGARGRGGR